MTPVPSNQSRTKARALQLNLIHGQRVTSFTLPLTPTQAEKLRELLAEQGFEFISRPYMLFSARKGKLSIAVYEKGPKVVIQGKETQDFVKYELEPKITGEARLGYEEVLQPAMFEPHFGIDESGKGDFFGPLVVAGVFVDRSIARQLLDLGVMDSKRISSDQRIMQLADSIRSTPGISSNVVLIGPEKYNELYGRFANLNDLLGWGHARVIENLLTERPDCPRSLSDKFANERVVQRALLSGGSKIEVEQRTKAESDIAVAGASILAREKFVRWLDRKGKELRIGLPKGVSAAVKTAAREIIAKYGQEALTKVAKMHFRTAAEVTGRVEL
jgi:ribonuclease HIII